MTLTKYKAKRNFKESPEPRGGKSQSKKHRFVIQLHDASHLHYDFRLEMEGVIKSWAVPKGPSTDPLVKRLAIRVEDHPFDYRNFEGIIPSGYGAGTVIVWDEGAYEASEVKGDKVKQDKSLIRQLRNGKLDIILYGKKLKGEYALIKTRKKDDNGWLFFKIKDKYASQDDILKKDKSVISKKTILQVKKTTKNFYGAPRLEKASSGNKKIIVKNIRADLKAASLKKKIQSKAKELGKEIPVARKKISSAIKLSSKASKPTGKSDRKSFLDPSEETQIFEINGHELKFTNLSKIFWPGEGITKRDMLNYYYEIAPFILPYLKDRPQSLNRYPDGIKGESFYQKDVTGKSPDWIKKYLYHSEADIRDKHFMVATNEASLLYMASLGCIEMNPWSSRIIKPEHPDWCIIDLDPAENTFEKVIEAAQVTRKILEDLSVDCYAKTSGSTGIHIYIPLGTKYTYEQSKEFARIIATLVQKELPEHTSIERSVKSRKGKIYIDFLQNRPQATVASPYSLRPKPGATVSMPLHWDEVKKGLKMARFNIHNAVSRIKTEGDIFKPVLGKGINLEKIRKNYKSNL